MSNTVDPFQNYQFILLQSISENIESITKNVRQIERSNLQAYSPLDNFDLTNHLIHNTYSKINEINVFIQSAPKKNVRYIVEKNYLSSQLLGLSQRFQQAQIKRKLLLKQSFDTQQQRQEIGYVSSLAIAYDRDQILSQIQQEIEILNDIMIDMAEMVNYQTEQLNRIEDHVQKADQDVVYGNENLSDGNEDRQSTLKKKLIIAGIITFILIVIAIIIILSLRPWDWK